MWTVLKDLVIAVGVLGALGIIGILILAIFLAWASENGQNPFQ
jgi:hypothetical protein